MSRLALLLGRGLHDVVVLLTQAVVLDEVAAEDGGLDADEAGRLIAASRARSQVVVGTAPDARPRRRCTGGLREGRPDHTRVPRSCRARRVDIATTTAAVAQVWRDGSRQAWLARLLRGVLEVELTRTECRRIGMLLGRSGGCDVADASVVTAASDGDEILTGDPGDIRRLAEASGMTLIITPI